jgi:hypothetical protein
MCVDRASRSFSFCQFPFVLDAAAKSRILRLAARTPLSGVRTRNRNEQHKNG